MMTMRIGEKNMSLTNELTQEKENIYSKAQETKVEFPKVDASAESYYVAYADSKHAESTIMEFSSEIPVLRKGIASLWKGTPMEVYMGDVLSAMLKCKDSEDSILEAIELFNYMM